MTIFDNQFNNSIDLIDRHRSDSSVVDSNTSNVWTLSLSSDLKAFILKLLNDIPFDVNLMLI
jgi:hypothetical protein